MKSHVKRSRATSCLAISCSTRFSPTSSTPAAASVSRSLGLDVLDGGQQLDRIGRAARAQRGLGDRGARGREVVAHDLELEAHARPFTR